MGWCGGCFCCVLWGLGMREVWGTGDCRWPGPACPTPANTIIRGLGHQRYITSWYITSAHSQASHLGFAVALSRGLVVLAAARSPQQAEQQSDHPTNTHRPCAMDWRSQQLAYSPQPLRCTGTRGHHWPHTVIHSKLRWYPDPRVSHSYSIRSTSQNLCLSRS